MKKNQGKSNEQHNIVSESGSDALLPKGGTNKKSRKSGVSSRRKTSKGNQDNLAISIIDRMSKLLYDSAGTIYHKLKHGLKIEEPFFVPGADSHYQQLMGKTADDILSFVQKVRPCGIYSVSMCFTAKDVINRDTQEKRDGFWVPYLFKASANYGLDAKSRQIPIRGRFNNEEWVYFKHGKEIAKAGESEIYVGMINMPHGGISFSERFINKIDRVDSADSTDEYEIIKTEKYAVGVDGVYLVNGKQIEYEFNDGADGQDENGEYIYKKTSKIRQRSQVVIVPIECQGNQRGDTSKRIGYLQVTGYNYSEGDNGKYINSDSNKGIVNESKVLNEDENDELITSTLKCYANYIVLTNKIESVKKVSVKTTWSLDT